MILLTFAGKISVDTVPNLLRIFCLLFTGIKCCATVIVRYSGPTGASIPIKNISEQSALLSFFIISEVR